MKSIVNFFRSISFNNKGKISANVMTGLSVGIFATFVGYSVYNAYNNSPAYNPSKRAIYTGEGLNSGGNSFAGGGLNSQNSGALSGSDYNGSRFFSGRGRKNSQSDADKEQAKFDAARAYIDSQKSGAIQAADADGAYQPFNSTYEQGADGMEFDAAGPNSAYGEDRFNEAQAAVAGAVAGVAGKGETNGKDGNKRQNGKGENDKAAGATAQVRQATQINKLASSSGSSTFGGVGGTGSNGVQGGVSTSFATGSTTGGGDNNTRALPSAQVDAGNLQAFKSGRTGNIGTFNVAAGGTENAGNGTRGSKGGDAKSQLSTAYALSTKAVASLQSEGEKSLATASQEASNAFDGGAKGEEGGPIIGDGISINTGSHNLDFKLGKASLGLDEVELDFEDHAEKKERLLNCVKSHLKLALLATFIASITIGFILQKKAWYTYIMAAIVGLAALYAIWFMDYDGDGMSITETISELAALRKEDGQSNPSWWCYGALGLMSGTVLSAFIWGPKVVAWFKRVVSDKVFGFVRQIFTSKATSDVMKIKDDVVNESKEE